MEEDINESSSSMLPVALGVLAIAIGGAGLYFGMTANQRLNPLSQNMEASSGSSAKIEKQLESFEVKLTELVAQTDELQQTVNRLRVYSAQTERDVKTSLSGIESNRNEMIKLVEKFNATTSGLRPQVLSSVAETSSSAETEEAVTVVSESGFAAVESDAVSIYSIQSGDNFAKVAASKGISLQALLDANPGVNPRSLQIGQKINIPSN